MIVLLRKDWRLYRGPIVGGIFLVFLPYVILGIVLLVHCVAFGLSPNLNPFDTLYHVANAALVMTALTAAIFGGVAFAQERRDRWAEFLAMLPVRRYEIVLSKIILSGGILGAPWSISAQIVLATAPGAETIDVLLLALTASASMMAFGVAWLASSFLSSPAISVGIAAVATIACLVWPSFFPAQIEKMSDVQLASVLIECTLGMGAVCLIAGTIHFMRRVEP
jgi:ABC-type transport system involved in multi-copper enzyme maturation permease subunit